MPRKKDASVKLTKFGWTMTTLTVVACGGWGGAVIAQQMAERASAQVERNQPGQGEGGDAVSGQLQLPAGFLNEERTRFFARPVGLALAMDGALLVSDDSNGVIYRIAYTTP
ncbi:hypothetical protein [Methylibium sp.]|uniref:hypothetical protein n=1 Tax=Methylibium sp. TaxID=2067992 RepID=UPI001857B598|nr:hypothetical protein [Methylibium sp.]MBA3591269.1 hypothetical protein [Methylibium sp.]